MKKQTKTYLLLGAVLLIWGAIGYRIVGSLSPEAPEATAVSSANFKPKPVQQRQVFSIAADYRDPFLGTMTQPKKKKTVQKQTAPKPTILEAKIAYTGYITDSETRQKIFFITLNGQQLMLSVGEKASDLTVLSGSKNKIKVRHQNKVRTITLQE